MKNQITKTQKWVQSFLAVLLLLSVSFTTYAQNPGGGFPPGGHHGGNPPFPPVPPIPPRPPVPPGNHHPRACDAHFFHHRDSLENGVRFFNLPGSGAATYAWDFGDGSNSTDPHPSHTYADSGLYNVCLTVTDTFQGGCSNTWCDTIHVFTPAPRCDARFWARRDSVPNQLHFLVPRFGPGIPGTTSTYSWDFGDGGSSTDPNPVHTYADSGFYYVCLTVTRTNSSGSCSATHCDSINTNLRPHRGPHRPPHHFKLADDVSELTPDVSVSVYPNPMTENATVFIQNASDDVIMTLYNSTGQIAWSKELTDGENTISKENLKSGLYFYTVTSGSSSIVKGKLQVY